MPPRRREPLSISIFTEDMPEFQLVRAGINTNIIEVALNRAAAKVARHWRMKLEESAAKQGFKRRYMGSIRTEKTGPLKVRVSASGKFVNFVEKGIKSFDMKPGLLSGKRARMGKDGVPYTIVGFRQGAPGTEGMPAMSEAMYREVRMIPAEQRMTRIGMTKRQNVHGDWVQQPIYRPGYKRATGVTGAPQPQVVGKGRWWEHRHREGKEEGMVRTRGGGYMTFRVVSARSRTRSWRYPGVPATPVFPGVNQDVPDVVKKSFAMSILSSLGAAAARGAAE